MLSKTLLDEMNNQIREELYSAYLYLAMAAHFEEANWPGFASWMTKQAAEEQEHAMKFFSYIHDRGGKVTLQAIAQPPASFGKPVEIFEQVLQHEQKVTARIHLLYSIAVKDNDYASQHFLDWFVNEQVEEEKNATQVLEWLKMAGDSVNALFQINGLLARRE
ncbi:MAG TPA: ferritin [Anaerolinea thermolimosa]|uniref:Ferritin n=1 Tax=Anaerolinea thermolimosa TaxID=229919 RepID=A0A3D1JHN2_9CHLR|nr:ferritin [Anaerolinea thermolimosa]GAP08044.1 ferritin-like protein [Anaerolinea thermolimosa]HCE17126.1 ferritin [Anaerolinea thermolimosa]